MKTNKYSKIIIDNCNILTSLSANDIFQMHLIYDQYHQMLINIIDNVGNALVALGDIENKLYIDTIYSYAMMLPTFLDYKSGYQDESDALQYIDKFLHDNRYYFTNLINKYEQK